MDEWIGWLIAVLENGIVVEPEGRNGFRIRLAEPQTEEQQPTQQGTRW